MPSPTTTTIVVLGLASLVTGIAATAGGPPIGGPGTWPGRVISWWYACDNDWPHAIRQINTTERLPLVTSVQTYCGWDISDAGKIIGTTSPQCLDFFGVLAELGVRAELATGAGNCSIATYRKLWVDTTESPQQLLKAALAANASGWNIDLEPQANNCKGGAGPIGTAADATLFATWLSAVRAVLNPHGIRLTADVASWSPVLGQFATLAPSVDRLQNMGTYNGDSKLQWEGGFNAFVHHTPSAAAGIGIGAWNVTGKTQWWETPAAAAVKVAASIKAGVPELAVFRLVPTPTGEAEWPLDFWWAALAPFLHR